MAKTRIKPGFLNLPPGSRVRENRGKSEGLSTLGSSSESRIKPGFFLYLTLSLSQALGQLGVGPLRPPLEGTLACRLGQALNGAHWAPAPPKGGGETWLSANFLVAHLLGSPSGGRYVPVGRCPAADRGGSRDAGTATAVTERATCQRFYTAHGRGPLAPRPLRHAFGMTPPPKGEARLGSPFGGAGTAAAVTERASSRDAVAARRLRGQLASAPHSSVSPRRRLYQRAAHALGGVTGKLGAKISAAPGGTEDPRRGSST